MKSLECVHPGRFARLGARCFALVLLLAGTSLAVPTGDRNLSATVPAGSMGADGPLRLPEPLIPPQFYAVQPVGVPWPQVPDPPFLIQFPPYFVNASVRALPVAAPENPTEFSPFSARPVKNATAVAQVPPTAHPAQARVTNVEPAQPSVRPLAPVTPIVRLPDAVTPPVDDPIMPSAIQHPALAVGHRPDQPAVESAPSVNVQPEILQPGNPQTATPQADVPGGTVARSSPGVARNPSAHAPQAPAKAYDPMASFTHDVVNDPRAQANDTVADNTANLPDLTPISTAIPGSGLATVTPDAVGRQSLNSPQHTADNMDVSADDPTGNVASIVFIGAVCAIIVGLAAIYYHLHRKTRANAAKEMIKPEHYEIEIRY